MASTQETHHGTAEEDPREPPCQTVPQSPALSSQGGRPQIAYLRAVALSLQPSPSDVFTSTPLPDLAWASPATPLPSVPSSTAVQHIPSHDVLSPTSSPAGVTYVPDVTTNLTAGHLDPCLVDSSALAVSMPFRDRRGGDGRSALLAFHTFIAIIVMLGSSGCLVPTDYSEATRLTWTIASRFGVEHSFSPVSLHDRWSLISSLANSVHPYFVFYRAFTPRRGPLGVSSVAGSIFGDAELCHAHAISGAIRRLRSINAIDRPPPLMAGDWSMGDIFRRWPPAVATELASFAWPIDTLDEFRRLLRCPLASPVAIMGCEFTSAVREAYSRAHGRVAISVDTRASLIPGPHSILDLTEVLMLKVWLDAYLFPPCTHQVLSDTRASGAKRLDGRTFWGISFFLFCWSVVAHRVRVEQPNTIIPQFIFQPSQRLRPCDAGDADSKPINLYERGWGPLELLATPVDALSGHRSLRDFDNADARDRWRSSWARFPCLCLLIVALSQAQLALDAGLRWCWRRADDATSCDCDDPEAVWGVEPPEDVTPSFLTLMEAFAVAWYRAGYPVPADYLNGKPASTSAEQRAYQSRRGAGDGRRIAGVVPVSLLNSIGGASRHLALLGGET